MYFDLYTLYSILWQVSLPAYGQRVAWTLHAPRILHGVVRFIGSIPNLEGTSIGVELHDEAGLHDGTVGGTRYFECRRFHGIIARPDHLVVDTT